MKTHRLHCQDPWFTLIRTGKKPVEGRKDLPKFQSWSIGDLLIFDLDHQSFRTRIVGLNRYKTLEDYLRTETLERTLPGVKTIEEGILTYLKWSSREEIEKFGFLAIEIELFP